MSDRKEFEELSIRLSGNCYDTNNNFAYFFDTEDKTRAIKELKSINFVPSYDHLCLFCGKKDSEFRCSGCNSVFFCSQACQKKSWKIHRIHCKRNLFCICATCGSKTIPLKCKNCPVRYCSEKCEEILCKQHVEYKDCEHFARMFSSK